MQSDSEGENDNGDDVNDGDDDDVNDVDDVNDYDHNDDVVDYCLTVSKLLEAPGNPWPSGASSHEHFGP